MEKCPSIPSDVSDSLRRLSASLEAAGLIRTIPNSQAWDTVINEWQDAKDLPLLVRRGGHPEMCMNIQHRSGRYLVPTDNSPAHWLVMQCFSCENPSLAYVRSHVKEIPMTMRMSKADSKDCDYSKTLDELDHAGSFGWYLAHVDRVGLGRIKELTNADLGSLKQHFVRLMSPTNMRLISRQVSGLAEIETFISLC
jgi:hypothetical protein